MEGRLTLHHALMFLLCFMHTVNPSSGGSWCVANPTASQTALQVAIDYACGYGGADCSAIQANGACFEPNTFHDHASYAFNNYYQKNPISTSCVFGGTAQLSSTDPSHGSCRYASPSATMPTTTPAIQTPPSTTTSVNPYSTGGGNGLVTEPIGNDFSGEPTGTTPSSAERISRSLLLMFINIICIILHLAMPSSI